MKESKDLKLFKNTIIEPKDDDNRTFEEYEATMDYRFINSLDGLIETEEGKDYKVTGCHTDDGDLAVLVYGYANDLHFQQIEEHSVNDRVKQHGHKGFQILEMISDRRVFESGEAEEVWLEPFVRYISHIWKGSQYKDDGTLEKDEHGLVKANYIYDYVWLVVEKDSEVPYNGVDFKWNKISDDKNDYYLVWINQ